MQQRLHEDVQRGSAESAHEDNAYDINHSGRCSCLLVRGAGCRWTGALLCSRDTKHLAKMGKCGGLGKSARLPVPRDGSLRPAASDLASALTAITRPVTTFLASWTAPKLPRAEEPTELPVVGLKEGEAKLGPESRGIGVAVDACSAQVEHWRSLLLPRGLLLPVSTTREDAALSRR